MGDIGKFSMQHYKQHSKNQEKCGTYKVGSLRAYENTPGSLFYITIGQDTFMADDVWLKTLEPRAQDPNN